MKYAIRSVQIIPGMVIAAICINLIRHNFFR